MHLIFLSLATEEWRHDTSCFHSHVPNNKRGNSSAGGTGRGVNSEDNDLQARMHKNHRETAGCIPILPDGLIPRCGMRTSAWTFPIFSKIPLAVSPAFGPALLASRAIYSTSSLFLTVVCPRALRADQNWPFSTHSESCWVFMLSCFGDTGSEKVHHPLLGRGSVHYWAFSETCDDHPLKVIAYMYTVIPPYSELTPSSESYIKIEVLHRFFIRKIWNHIDNLCDIFYHTSRTRGSVR